jgi:hypothetical protein
MHTYVSIQQQAHIGAAPFADCKEDGLECKTESDCCSHNCFEGQCFPGTASYLALPSASDMALALFAHERFTCLMLLLAFVSVRGINQSLRDALKESCVFGCDSAAFQFLL